MYSLAELGIIQQREELGSVNMDEEVTDLLRYQRAFQATSKVISTLDQLLETVVTGLIR
jgi:flagellar hook-associated protein 1 FlgK